MKLMKTQDAVGQVLCHDITQIIKDVKTGHSDGYVKITVDKASGNVTEATYYFVWTLSLTALSANVSIPFGLEKNFTIAW